MIKRFLAAGIAACIYILVIAIGFKTTEGISQDIVFYILFFQFVYIHIVSIFIDVFFNKGLAMNEGITTFSYLTFGIVGNIVMVNYIAGDLLQTKEEYIIMGLAGVMHAVFYYMTYSMMRKRKARIK